MSGRLGFWLLFAPFALWIAFLIVIPHVELLTLAMRVRVAPRVYEPGLGNFAAVLGDPLYLGTLARTILMSLLATAATLLVAFPMAWRIAKLARGRSRAALFLACLLPFWVSEIVRVFGWMILLRETGVVSRALQAAGLVEGPVEFLYTDATVMLGLVYTSLLFMVVPLVSTLDSLDDSLIEAAYDLGGTSWSILREIVVPHAMPGLVSGCIVVFMLCLGNYLTPALLGGKNSTWFTAQIYSQFVTRFNWELGSAFGFALLGASTLIVWAALRLTGQTLAGTLGR